MFSWSQPSYCKTEEEEYFVLKALFMIFVAPRQIMETMGRGVGETIIKFAWGNKFPHEERMVYFKHHGLF
jgi:hypothetical protein